MLSDLSSVLPRILILDHLGDGLVVTLDHSDRMGTARVQVVDVAGQRDADHEVAAPETSQLLIFDLVAHGKGDDGLVSLNVPKLAGLVTRRRQEPLVVGAPRDGVDASSVRVLPIRQKLCDQFGLLPLVEEDLSVEPGGGPKDAVWGVANRLAVSGVLLKLKQNLISASTLQSEDVAKKNGLEAIDQVAADMFKNKVRSKLDFDTCDKVAI